MLSWLFESLVSNIPVWIWIIGVGAGLGIYFFSSILTHIPEISPYAKFVKPVAGIVALVCTFMYGGAGVQAIWEEKIRIAEEQAKIAEAKAEQLNDDLKKARDQKTQVRVEYRDRVKYEIRTVAAQIDANCNLSPIAVEKINKAAKNPEGTK